MKKIVFTFCIALLIIAAYTLNRKVFSYAGGAPPGSTNAPGENTCSTVLCHQGTPNLGPELFVLDIMEDVSNGYQPGFTYTIMPWLSQQSSAKTGFQTVALLSNGQGAGSVTITNIKTKMDTSGGKEYVTHTVSGNTNVGLHDWMYEWTAPPQGSGTVTIYCSFISANSNNAASGDSIYATYIVLPEASTSVAEKGISALNMKVFPLVSPGDFKVNFNADENISVEMSVYTISGVRIQQQGFDACAGANFIKVDLGNRAGGMYFISLEGDGISEVRKVIKY